MLAQMGTKADLTRKGWIFEPKLDGTRVLIFKDGKRAKFVNRRGTNIAYRYPEINPIENIKAKRAILDGEIVVFDKKGRPDFHLLAEREHILSKLKIRLRSKLFPATLIVFDILSLNRRDLTKKPLLERKGILERTVMESDRVKLCFWTRDGQMLWREVVKRRLEGVMAKKASSPYVSRRSGLWLKIKALKSQDCVIVGWTSGTGRRKAFGSLILGAYKDGGLIYVGKVGTGFTESDVVEILRQIKKLQIQTCPFKTPPKLNIGAGRHIFWARPVLVCEVRYMHLSEQGIMRAPAFLRMRTDKPAKECVQRGLFF